MLRRQNIRQQQRGIKCNKFTMLKAIEDEEILLWCNNPKNFTQKSQDTSCNY